MSGIRLTETARAALDVLADQPGRMSARQVHDVFVANHRGASYDQVVAGLDQLARLWLVAGGPAAYHPLDAGWRYVEAMRRRGR